MKSKKLIILIAATILIIGGIFGCGNSQPSQDTEGQTTKEAPFAEFAGKDLDGNEVDQSLLKDNKVTVLNFWFNGCSACVSEMPELETFNKELKEKGAELVGVNIGNDDEIEEAKRILSEQGATYKNIVIREGDKALSYMNDMDAFPTTVLVDQDGNVIGKPICGTINNKEAMDKIMKEIDEATK